MPVRRTGRHDDLRAPGDAGLRASPAPAAYLLDLDGTVYTEHGLIEGAARAVATLRAQGRPLRFVTNTTRMPRRGVVERLAAFGIPAEGGDVFTAVSAAATALRARGVRRVAPYLVPETLEDLSDLDLRGGTSNRPDGTVEAVLVGDLGEAWRHDVLNDAFRRIMDGALLVVAQKNRYWVGRHGLELDAGAYVAALEFAAGRTAVVCGKPSATFFAAALADLGGQVDPATVAMVGDDVWGDVGGAQRAGLQGWLVRTGRFRPDALRESGVTPDRILDSLADLVRE